MRHNWEDLTINDLRAIAESPNQPQETRLAAAAEIRQYRYQEQIGIADILSQ
jgi:hypothetical protein